MHSIRTLLFSVTILLASKFAHGQNIWQKYRDVPRAQKVWAAMHIRYAEKIYRISVECRDFASAQLGSYPLDSISRGGTADAFRHGYWMARLAQQYPRRICLSLGRAYERGNRQTYRQQRRNNVFLYDRASQEMDLRNNRIGADLGRRMPGASPSAIAEELKLMIAAGQFYVIAAAPDGKIITDEGASVDPSMLPHRWDNGKTLAKSAPAHH